MYKRSRIDVMLRILRVFLGCLQGQSTDSIPFAIMNASLLFQGVGQRLFTIAMGKTSVILSVSLRTYETSRDRYF